MATLHIGLVGVGRWGQNYIRHLRSLHEVRLHALCDVDAGRLSEAGRHAPEAQRHTTVTTLLEQPLDALVVATPPHTHAEIASAALSRGLHVLVEKPLATHPELAERLVSESVRASRLLAVGHLSLHSAALREGAASVGPLRTVVARRVSLGAEHSNESAILGLVSHDVASLIGPLRLSPSRVRARSMHTERPNQAVVVDIELGRVTARIEASRLGPERVREFTLVGSLGDRTIDELACPPGAMDALAVQCARFVERIRACDHSPHEARIAARVVAVLAAAERSLHAGGPWIELASPPAIVERIAARGA